MNGVGIGKPAAGRFSCTHGECGATFTKQWKLKDHETVHTGERPWQCGVVGCGRRFSRRSGLSRHRVQHSGVKTFKCQFVSCSKTFFHADKLKRHVSYAHGDKTKHFKCKHPGCSMTFRKRRGFKLHLKDHGLSAEFKCSVNRCSASFDSHIARKAHEKTHAGYSCPRADCDVRERTWGRLEKHMAQHPASFACKVCKKAFKKADALRRHKWSHASHKPVLVCPRENCQAYFSTTFNLEHHIRKVHLQLLKYKCSFPDCPRTFAMRESVSRHLLRHDPGVAAVRSHQKHRRPKKTWQKRVNGHEPPVVEDNLQRLFALRMRISRRAKVEANLAGLFNERKIPHYVDPEVNLRGLFSIKRPRAVEAPAALPLTC
ncbi:P43 5S RNA-binding protein-like [Betta splendens]|uniref:P43 5S RNA-binding protein-like n=1 Tax=Betta splendens TaxID=158456 RepID=A0A6P7N367_BETSP|nr:P43 5S RNA-binding protein-like [Betta splendens]